MSSSNSSPVAGSKSQVSYEDGTSGVNGGPVMGGVAGVLETGAALETGTLGAGAELETGTELETGPEVETGTELGTKADVTVTVAVCVGAGSEIILFGWKQT